MDTITDASRVTESKTALTGMPPEGERRYAIAFDMDIELSRVNYGDPHNNACAEIRRLPWFESSVRDIRMLRIEEYNNLLPAVESGAGRDR